MGNIGNKYRVHEVAKDFGLPTKQITEILTQYAQTPKNHMQALEDRELSLIFEYLTQHNPVSGIQVIFAEGDEARREEGGAGPGEEGRAEEGAGQGPGPQGGACPEKAGGEAGPAVRPAHEPGAQDQGGGHQQGHQH